MTILFSGKIAILYKKFNEINLKMRDITSTVDDLEEMSHKHESTTTTTTTTTTSTTSTYSDYSDSDYSGEYDDDSYSNSTYG